MYYSLCLQIVQFPSVFPNSLWNAYTK